MRTLAKQSKRSKRPQDPSAAITAPFALPSAGQALINVSQCEGRDLAGREVFMGVPISEEEAQLTRHAVDNAVFDVAAKVAGTMRETKPAPASGSEAQIRKTKTAG